MTASALRAASDQGLFGDYRAPTGGFDEMLAADGTLRPHWGALVRSLDALGRAELAARRREAARLLRDEGVTYNAYDRGISRATDWVLDPIPMLLTSEEWVGVERGVRQRAELLNLVLDDLYGPQLLVRDGLVPPEIVHGHPGFLRPAHGVRLPGSHQLVSYAVELARDVAGRFWVLSDFAQSPSGMGYAHENRRVLSRVLPTVYRGSHVRRLAPFFRALRGGLGEVAPPGIDDPRLVVLSPGPLNETYFEHAQLANHLGCALVEGADLTVRHGRVLLRALGGLEPVHVILRRVDGWYCDPLELRPDSQLGVPGLTEAARRQAVSVVNPFGSGVLENGGLVPFLPALAERLLGAPLSLPSARTWWCGDDAQREQVLAELAGLVIKPIAREQGRQSIYGWRLSAAERAALARRIEARPHAFIAQERTPFSSIPCLTGDGAGARLEARPVVLRSFAVAHQREYQVLPGGLARVAATGDAQVLSARSGGMSKDVWVLAAAPEAQTGFWVHAGPRVVATEAAAAVSARAGENLFWLGRYAERAESTIRLLRVILDRREFAGDSYRAGRECLDTLLVALTHLTATYPGFAGPAAAPALAQPEPELLAVVSDAERVGTLAFSLRSLLAAAQAVRDQLSSDTWLVVSEVERELEGLDLEGPDPEAALQAVLAGLIRSMLALAGLAHESMVRDPGWLFMDVGRRLERALLTVSLLRSTALAVGSAAAESLVLESLLIATESIVTYRRRYRSHAQVETVLELLLLDEGNPRSVAGQLTRLDSRIAELPAPAGGRPSAEELLVIEARELVRVADVGDLAAVARNGPAPVEEQAGGGRRAGLERLLGAMDEVLTRAARAVDATHFTHVAPGHPYTAGVAEGIDGGVAGDAVP